MKTLMAAVVLMGFVTGCVIPIPTPHGRTTEGTEVNRSELAFLQSSVTTKAEVIQRLGEPTIFWRDENTLVYRWVKLKGVLLWAIAGGYNADFGAADITAEYAFMVKFDAADRFVCSAIAEKKGRKSFGQFLLDWRDAQPSKSLKGKESAP